MNSIFLEFLFPTECCIIVSCLFSSRFVFPLFDAYLEEGQRGENTNHHNNTKPENEFSDFC
jgi:hypothetical protein